MVVEETVYRRFMARFIVSASPRNGSNSKRGKIMSSTKTTIGLATIAAMSIVLAATAPGYAGHRSATQHPSHSGAGRPGAPASGITQSPITSQSTPGSKPSGVPRQQ